jgi:hypothetical protein
MDCFVASDFARRATADRSLLAMTSRHSFAISPHVWREVWPGRSALCIRGRRECRTLGASAAACGVVESTRVSHHGHAANVRHSPRNGFNGFLRALPGDRALLPPSSAKMAPANLTPASGRQDHTTSPSASGTLVSGAVSVHRIPPHVRDDRETPLLRSGTAGVLGLIWGKREAEYFCAGGWTGN